MRGLTAAVVSSLVLIGCSVDDNADGEGPDSTSSPTLKVEGNYEHAKDWCAEIDFEALTSAMPTADIDESDLDMVELGEPNLTEGRALWGGFIDISAGLPQGSQGAMCAIEENSGIHIVVKSYAVVLPSPEDAAQTFDPDELPQGPFVTEEAEDFDVKGWESSLLQLYPDRNNDDWATGSMFGHDSNLILMIDGIECYTVAESGDETPCPDDEFRDFIAEIGDQTRDILAK